MSPPPHPKNPKTYWAQRSPWIQIWAHGPRSSTNRKSAGPSGPTGCGGHLTKVISSVKQICKGTGIQVSWSSLYWCLRGLAPYCLVFLVEPRTTALASPADYLDFLGPPGYTLKSYPKSYPPQEEPTALPDTLNGLPRSPSGSKIHKIIRKCWVSNTKLWIYV